MALGMYFLARFHQSGESFPTFETRQSWYNIKLLLNNSKKATNETPLGDDAHRAAVSKVLKSVNVRSIAITHLRRKAGSHFLQINGLSREELRIAGHWNMDVIDKHYVDTLPRAAMRLFAGFDPRINHFHIVRATIQPPESLQQMIFPKIEQILPSLVARNDASGNNTDFAAENFLKLLKYLRVIILQDAVAMMRLGGEYGHHPLFKLPVFKTSEFNLFRACLNEVLDKQTELEVQPQAQAIIPEVLKALETFHSTIQG